MSTTPPQLYPENSPRPTKSGAGISIIVIAAVAVPVLLVCGGIMVGLLLPAVQAAREAARRMQCSNNEKQIALALLNYESVYRALPPAYTVGENGRKLHSWRTLILPYMGQMALYEQIDLTKPWDDPANSFLQSMEIEAYRCPSSPIPQGYTNYVAVVHPQGVFSGSGSTRYREIIDGSPNTILLVEVPENLAVRWMEPADTTLPEFVSSLQGRTNHAGGVTNVAMADGAVQTFASEAADIAEMLVTKDGQETQSPSSY